MKHVYLTFFAFIISFTSFAVIGPITGASSVCAGGTAPLSDTTAGGTWSSSNPAIGSISTTGVVTGISGGSINITYTRGAGFVTMPFTVNPLPLSYPLFFGGSGSICVGGPGSVLYLGGSQPGFMYQLYLGGTAVGSPLMGTGSAISFGPQTIAGPYAAIAIDPVTGCVRTLGPATLTVVPAPASIVGPSSVCLGSSITLTDATPGGTWSSSNPSVAAIGTSGVVTSVSVGTTTISYTMPTGCYVTMSLPVINLVSPITGSGSTCVSSTTTFIDATPGGTWASSNIAIAVVGSTGVVRGVAAGTATISYTVGGSCGYVTKLVTVAVSPAAITGITSICAGAVSTLHDATTGGVWSSGNPTVATVGSSSGVVSGVSGGTAPVSYTVGGCSATTTMAVDPTPLITGASGVCVFDTIILNTSIPGSWTSSNPAIADITSAGAVSGHIPGTATITCNSFSTGCVSTHPVVVTSSCSGTPAGGSSHASNVLICSGKADTLYLAGASTACGIAHQWQYSFDSISWYTVAGGTFDTAVVHPQQGTYYRCKLTCYSGGGFSYSSVTHVNVFNSISSHYITNTPSYTCDGPNIFMATCGIGTATKLKTYYGDGTSDSVILHSSSPDSSAGNSTLHAYNLPGTYTVKQVLYEGTNAQDSLTDSFTYSYCRTLPVYYYFDANNNCIPDDYAYMYHNITTEVDSNGIAIDTVVTNWGFYYRALGGSGTVYGFKVIGFDTGLHLSCPTTGIVYDTITAYANTYAVKYIGFNCATTTAFDLGVASAGLSCGRHVANGFINVRNTYCTPVTTVVTMTFSPKYTFASSYPAPFSVVGNTVTWHIAPLSAYSLHGGTWWPDIAYTLNVPGPFLTAGDTVYSSYKITPYTGDADTTDNFVERVDTIYTSFDPNRITVSPRGFVIPCTPLTYAIDFENTGNAPARNIAVIDTLPDSVDPSAIKLISSTAPVTVAVVNFGAHTLVKFDFAGINLPDSSHHNACDGQVVFSVKARQGLTDGTNIFNRASIYFDDNLPVLTNTIGNTIGMSPITGPSNVCNTYRIQLNDLSQFGVWSRSNTNASVTSNGLVTGLSAGVDTIRYTLTSSCGSRTQSKVVVIDPTVVPAVSITSTSGSGDTVCSGTNATFTAAAVNGGTTPLYQWMVNGINSGTGSAFGYMPPVNGDVVSVKLVSNAACRLPDTAVDLKILTVVEPNMPPITLDAYPGTNINPGSSDTFVATIPAGSQMPSYQWLLNGAAVPGATTDTFVATGLVNGDSVTCMATGTDLCKLTTFNSFIITVGVVGVNEFGKRSEMVLFPNPNNGVFNIKGKTGKATDGEVYLEVVNALGRAVFSKSATSKNGVINEKIQPDVPFVKGIYLLNLRTPDGKTLFRFVVE